MGAGIAFLGIGHSHSASKLRAVENTPGCDLVGLCEPNPDTRRDRQSQAPFNTVRWFDTQEELLACESVDAVFVDGLVKENVQLSTAALDADKHVLLEKPAGTRLPDIRQLQALAAQRGAYLQMGYQFRYTPGFACLRGLAKEGVLGDVFCCRARIGKDRSLYDRLEPELRHYPGGTLFELGCHPMDFIIGLMGKPSRTLGVCRTDYRADTPLADNTVAVLEFAAGIGIVESAMMEVAAFARRRVEVYGTHGTAVLQPFDATQVQLTLDEPRGGYGKGEHGVLTGSWPMFEGDVREFLAVMEGTKPPEYSAEHDLWVQSSLLEACGVESPGSA